MPAWQKKIEQLMQACR